MDIFNQIPGFIGWKDNNFSYLGCNASLAAFLRFKHGGEIIGLSDLDLFNQTSESAAFHRQHDQEALRGNIIKTIHKSELANSHNIYFQIKKPLLEKGNVTGVIFHCHEFLHTKLFMSLQEIDRKNCAPERLPLYYEIGARTNPHRLSARELECLFFTLRGLSANEVATRINLSKRTIEFYLENIKNKFNCLKKSELIAAAIDHGYMNFVPEYFLA